jgi:hypothetical protein
VAHGGLGFEGPGFALTYRAELQRKVIEKTYEDRIKVGPDAGRDSRRRKKHEADVFQAVYK